MGLLFVWEDYVSSVDNSLKALNYEPGIKLCTHKPLGIVYIKQGTYKRAYAAYESLLKYSPEHDEYEGGIRDLMELQRNFRESILSEFCVGPIFQTQGRNMEASEEILKFLRQNFPVANWHHKARSLLSEKNQNNQRNFYRQKDPSPGRMDLSPLYNLY
ncbi:MAG: hypothetical protein Ct9H300mP28_28130 [Pseudomonadota bacterium]|nr:MAG: hypothetical protein Ct9H300mP28_28130 [Pseudomonadota bacterium]